MIKRQYAGRDIRDLDRIGNYYCRHVEAMTAERLHSKSDIAAELAYRDAEIDRLRSAQIALLDSAKDVIAWCDKTGSGDALYCIDRLRHAIAVIEIDPNPECACMED